MSDLNSISRDRSQHDWTFLTNHSHVLICLYGDPHMRMREVAERVGITERAVQKIVLDLEQAGILSREREGRRNRYVIHTDQPLRHPVECHCSVRDLLAMVLPGDEVTDSLRPMSRPA